MAETALIKLGGSVITNKERLRSFSAKQAISLSAEIASYLSGGRDRRAVLVHGGGSFGHVKAKSFSLAGGLREERQLAGFAEVRKDMRDLDNRIADVLIRAGVNAISFAPETLVDVSGGDLIGVHLEPVDRALANALVPLTFGDAVLDEKLVFTILSGDKLMETLSRHLKPSVAVFCTDVDGVFASNPKLDVKARLIEKLTPSVRVALDSSDRSDVTGEMGGKVGVLFNIAGNSRRTFVINGRVRGRLTAALEGSVASGTEVSVH